jgi:hypothetical protein
VKLDAAETRPAPFVTVTSAAPAGGVGVPFQE